MGNVFNNVTYSKANITRALQRKFVEIVVNNLIFAYSIVYFDYCKMSHNVI